MRQEGESEGAVGHILFSQPKDPWKPVWLLWLCSAEWVLQRKTAEKGLRWCFRNLVWE